MRLESLKNGIFDKKNFFQTQIQGPNMDSFQSRICFSYRKNFFLSNETNFVVVGRLGGEIFDS